MKPMLGWTATLAVTLLFAGCGPKASTKTGDDGDTETQDTASETSGSSGAGDGADTSGSTEATDSSGETAATASSELDTNDASEEQDSEEAWDVGVDSCDSDTDSCNPAGGVNCESPGTCPGGLQIPVDSNQFTHGWAQLLDGELRLMFASTVTACGAELGDAIQDCDPWGGEGIALTIAGVNELTGSYQLQDNSLDAVCLASMMGCSACTEEGSISTGSPDGPFQVTLSGVDEDGCLLGQIEDVACDDELLGGDFRVPLCGDQLP